MSPMRHTEAYDILGVEQVRAILSNISYFRYAHNCASGGIFGHRQIDIQTGEWHEVDATYSADCYILARVKDTSRQKPR